MLNKVALLALVASFVSAKFTVEVARSIEKGEPTDIVIEFGGTDQTLASVDARLRAFTTRAERIAYLQESLEADALTAQARVRQLLKVARAKSQAFWISNSIIVENALPQLVNLIAQQAEVTVIRKPFVATLPVVEYAAEEIAQNRSILATEWGIEKVQAPQVWATGNRGEGIVVGSIDTGARYTHEAIKGNWRSQYGWFDPTRRTATPSDGNGHGTHTIATSVGQTGVGVAPNAQWISCQGCPSSSCTEAALTGCAQFMTCPTDTSGANRRCDLAPNVINNSWGSNDGASTFYQTYVNAWRAAGIIPVFANGNNGAAGCRTVGTPGAFRNVIGVGATDINDGLASFSSKGPTPDGRIKPDISAPGAGVRSAWSTGDTVYRTISGTSMATPHVTGAVALILAKNKGATYDTVYNLLAGTVDTATLRPTNSNCGGVSDAQYPNNSFGRGRLNVAKATGTA